MKKVRIIKKTLLSNIVQFVPQRRGWKTFFMWKNCVQRGRTAELNSLEEAVEVLSAQNKDLAKIEEVDYRASLINYFSPEEVIDILKKDKVLSLKRSDMDLIYQALCNKENYL